MEKWSREYLISNLPTMHRSVTESSSFNLQAEYIRKASTIDDVPVHYHKLYKVRLKIAFFSPASLAANPRLKLISASYVLKAVHILTFQSVDYC